MRKFSLSTLLLISSLIFSKNESIAQMGTLYHEDQFYRESIIPNLREQISEEVERFVVFYSDNRMKLDSTLEDEFYNDYVSVNVNFEKFLGKDSLKLKREIFEFCADFIEEFFNGRNGDHERFNIEVNYDYEYKRGVELGTEYVLIISIHGWSNF